MSRSLLVHSQRFRLGLLTLVLITGTPTQVIDQIRDNVDNKMSFISAGVHKNGQKAMALFINGDAFDGDINEARKIAISSDLVKGILGGYNIDHKWTFLSMLTAGRDKLDVAIGGKFLGQIKSVQQFVKDFAQAIYGKNSDIAGSTSDTKTMLLLAPDTERYAFAWNHETDVQAVLAQPYGDNTTRYSVAGDALLAIQAGTGQLKVMSFQQIQAKIDSADVGQQNVWKQTLQLKDSKIDDIALGYNLGGNTYAVIASGNFQGHQGMKVLNVTTDGENIRVLPTPQAIIALDETTASYGSAVRYDGTAVTFVNRNGGDNSITRVALSALPPQVKSAFTQSASA